MIEQYYKLEVSQKRYHRVLTDKEFLIQYK